MNRELAAAPRRSETPVEPPEGYVWILETGHFYRRAIGHLGLYPIGSQLDSSGQAVYEEPRSPHTKGKKKPRFTHVARSIVSGEIVERSTHVRHLSRVIVRRHLAELKRRDRAGRALSIVEASK